MLSLCVPLSPLCPFKKQLKISEYSNKNKIESEVPLSRSNLVPILKYVSWSVGPLGLSKVLWSEIDWRED